MVTELLTTEKMNRAIPYLAVHDAEHALEFYAKAFGAKEVSERIPWEGKIGHSEVEIEGARVMLADEFPAYNKSPKTLGGTSVAIPCRCKGRRRILLETSFAPKAFA